VALLAVPLEAGPGQVPLHLTWANGSRQQWTCVLVAPDPYPHLPKLKVPKLRRKLKAAAAANEKETLEDAEAEALEGPPLWRGAFQWPLDAPIVITSPFGVSRVYNRGQAAWRHRGVDLRAPEGTPVLADNDGRVLLARRRLHATGGTIVLGHGYGLCSSYFHLSKLQVKAGQAVVKGQILGFSGSTGLTNGPHLHWQMDLRGESVEPQQWLEGPQP
jgi:murein DD-endopeptidase MepM/ murein hydrolase activator NlpD